MLSAKELGISEAEHAALIVVRDRLADGTYKHTDLCEPADGQRFNMNIPFAHDEGCGTIACIGGWVAHAMGYKPNKAYDYVMSVSCFDSLYHLYFPRDTLLWSDITPDIAARTITTFLDSGEVDFASHI